MIKEKDYKTDVFYEYSDATDSEGNSAITREPFLEAANEIAKQEALAFIHFTEFKMSDDDWLDEKGDLKSMQDVWKMYKNQPQQTENQ